MQVAVQERARALSCRTRAKRWLQEELDAAERSCVSCQWGERFPCQPGEFVCLQLLLQCREELTDQRPRARYQSRVMQITGIYPLLMTQCPKPCGLWPPEPGHSTPWKYHCSQRAPSPNSDVVSETVRVQPYVLRAIFLPTQDTPGTCTEAHRTYLISPGSGAEGMEEHVMVSDTGI